MSVVFFKDQDIIEITPAHLVQLKIAAQQAPLRRARLCLHHNHEDAVHEMVIAFCQDSYIRPHRHLAKSESFHVIEGRLMVVIFDDMGQITRRLTLESYPNQAAHPFFYRLNAAAWHSVVGLSEFVIIHEVTPGPFNPDQKNQAPWSPAENDPGGQKIFIENIMK